ncbi:MAG: hypothetical protein NWQ19_11365 [Nonlabens sp.]|nr:hypothetical protein [Nonlabens sp.]
MKLLLILFFNVCLFYGNAQNCASTYEQIQKGYQTQTLTLEQLEAAIESCGDINKYPKLYYYRGMFAFDNENFALGIFELERVYKYVDEPDSKYTIQTNLGILYAMQQKYEGAKKAFQKAYDLAVKMNDSAKRDHAYQSLMAIELDNGNEAYLAKYEAYFVNKDFQGNDCEELHTLSFLSEFYVSFNQINSADRLISEYFNPKKNYSDCAMDYMSLYGIKAKIAISDKDYKKALLTLDSINLKSVAQIDRVPTYKLYQEIHSNLEHKDAATQYADSVIMTLEQNKVRNNETNAKALAGLAKKDERDGNKISNLFMYIILIGIALVMALGAVYYYRKSKKEVEVKKNFYKENYNNLWGSFQLSNKKLEILKEELLAQKKHGNSPQYNDLLKDINIHLDASANDVHKHVNMVENPFVIALRKEAPYLSDAEINVCFFFRLNMSHKKIAEILSKTEKSIDSYRYRINKKVLENQNIELKTLLQRIDY